MADLTNLLSQADEAEHADRTETLADTLRKHAKDLTDEDLIRIVNGLREQRTRWNAAQAAGSKERVSSKKITVTAPKALPRKFGVKVIKPVI